MLPPRGCGHARRTCVDCGAVICRAQVQNLLQQMQGRFATMSDAIIGRSARHAFFSYAASNAPLPTCKLTSTAARS